MEKATNCYSKKKVLGSAASAYKNRNRQKRNSRSTLIKRCTININWYITRTLRCDLRGKLRP